MKCGRWNGKLFPTCYLRPTTYLLRSRGYCLRTRKSLAALAAAKHVRLAHHALPESTSGGATISTSTKRADEPSVMALRCCCRFDFEARFEGCSFRCGRGCDGRALFSRPRHFGARLAPLCVRVSMFVLLVSRQQPLTSAPPALRQTIAEPLEQRIKDAPVQGFGPHVSTFRTWRDHRHTRSLLKY